MIAKIRCDDEVTVLTGRDRGKRDKVENILSPDKVIVEDINLVKKRQKLAPTLNQPGDIVEKEATTQISSPVIFNMATGRAGRVDFRFKNGRKIRFLKSNSGAIR